MRKRKRNGLFYSKGEETVNSLSHGIGISMAVIIGGFFLMKCYRAQDSWAILGMWLYLFGMGGSYLSSTLYHSLKHHNPWKRRLRHWDHAAIYWHIAGSFSPITLIALRDEGLWGWGLFCFVWLCAVAGTIISFRKMEEHSYVETVCYILMGLSVLVVFKQLFAVAPASCYWIIAEGVCYIGGAALYSIRNVRYMHSAFHFFVLAGSSSPCGTFWRRYKSVLSACAAPSADYSNRAFRQFLIFHGSVRRGIAQSGTAVHTMILGNTELGKESAHIGIVTGLSQLVNPARADA